MSEKTLASFMDTVAHLERISQAIRDDLAAKAGDKNLDDIPEDQLENWTKEIVFSIFNGDAVSAWAEHGTFGSINAKRIREQAEKVLDGETVEEPDAPNVIEMFAALIRHLPIVMYYGYRHREMMETSHSKVTDSELMRILTGVYTGTPVSEVSENALDELNNPNVQSTIDGIYSLVSEHLDEMAISMLLRVVKGRTKVNAEAFGTEWGRQTSRDFLTGLAIGLSIGKEFHRVRS